MPQAKPEAGDVAVSGYRVYCNDAGYDPLEDRLRENIRSTIEAVFEEELAQFLGRCRYGREDALRQGYRNGHRERQLTGTFGTERVSVPRARIVEEDGRASEWRSRALPRYQRLTRKAEALIASVYLSGTNTRRVKRALFGLFRGAVSKDVVSRAWRKVKVDWDAWCSRGLADEDIVRLILDGTVIKTRLDRKATNISVLAAIGVRRDGQKVLLSIGNMGGESQAAWRQFLDDLDARGLKRPGFVIVDGAPGLEAALSALWGDDLPVQRCTVHKHRNLLGHAPKHMHDELSEDYRDMIYADTASEVETRRKAFVRKWRLKYRQRLGKLYTVTNFPTNFSHQFSTNFPPIFLHMMPSAPSKMESKSGTASGPEAGCPFTPSILPWGIARTGNRGSEHGARLRWLDLHYVPRP